MKHSFLKISLALSILNCFMLNTCLAQEMAAPVKTRNGWGYIKKDLTWLIPAKFDRFWHDNMVVIANDDGQTVLCEFHDGMARMRKGGMWGYYNKQGVEVINAHFKEEYNFNDSVAAVNQRGDWGFIDKQGNLIVDAVYDDVQSFYGGIAAVKQHGNWGYINKHGEWLITPQYKIGRAHV